VPDPDHRIDVAVLRDGMPLANAPVHLLGSTRGLPPQTLTTDRAGRLRLDAVTVPTLRMEIPGYMQSVVDVESASAVFEVAVERE